MSRQVAFGFLAGILGALLSCGLLTGATAGPNPADGQNIHQQDRQRHGSAMQGAATTPMQATPDAPASAAALRQVSISAASTALAI